MGRDVSRPDPSGGCGVQRRARAALRAATHRPAWAEHGEHGEDPPLARSEHRGTNRTSVTRVIHRGIACVCTKGSRILWVQGFRLFKPLICLKKKPRPLTNGGPVLTNGGRTPD
jgi:hypothetical protein